MSIIHLPDDLVSDSHQMEERTFFYGYDPPLPIIKGKCVLHKNLISFLVEGEKRVHYANQVFNVCQEEFLMLSAGNSLMTEKPSERGEFKSVILFFDSQVLTDFKIKYADTIRKLMTQKTEKHTYLLLPKDDFIRNYIRSLQLIVCQGSELTPEMRQLKLEEFFLYLLQTKPSLFLGFHNLSKKESDKLEIEKILEANVATNITVEELAFLCHMSLSTFKRYFALHYKLSPNKWILQRRMDLAKDLLKQSDHKPSDIYYKLGYENHSSFTETFKHTFGITPKQYQQQVLNE